MKIILFIKIQSAKNSISNAIQVWEKIGMIHLPQGSGLDGFYGKNQLYKNH